MVIAVSVEGITTQCCNAFNQKSAATLLFLRFLGVHNVISLDLMPLTDQNVAHYALAMLRAMLLAML